MTDIHNQQAPLLVRCKARVPFPPPQHVRTYVRTYMWCVSQPDAKVPKGMSSRDIIKAEEVRLGPPSYHDIIAGCARAQQADSHAAYA